MSRRLFGSLRVKVAAGVIAVLVVAMGAVFALQYRWFERELIERLGLSSTPLSDVIKGSLHHAMQTRDLSELAAIVDNVSRQPGVVKVFVVNKQGEIRMSPVRADIGTRVPLTDATCQICHRVAPTSRSHTVIFTAAGGRRIFRNVNPIVNEPACHRCHDPRAKLNGVLISDFSMAAIDRELAGKRREMILGLVLAVGVTALGITLVMNRLVVSKLERFVHATRLLGRGRMDFAIPAEARDEMGTLATSFNQMVESLRRARELRERTALLENVLDNVDDAVVVLTPDATVLACNRGGERLFDVRATDVVGHCVPLLGAEQERLVAQARTAGPVTVEMDLDGAAGGAVPARVHLAPLRGETGTDLACLVVAQDLTEERAQTRLSQELAQAEKLAATGRLAAGVAHELNNPRGNVLMNAKLLLEDLPDDDPRARNARRIVENTLRCKAIVRSLLECARQSDVDMAWTDLNALAGACVAHMQPDLAAHRISSRLALAPALPPVRCDGRQIHQILVNLVQNAIDAIGEDGTAVVATAVAPDGRAVVLSVTDDGPGIPEEARARVFEPFYTTKPQGMGLGLAICYGIVARHRGAIRFESRCEGPARGSTFVVTLPVAA